MKPLLFHDPYGRGPGVPCVASINGNLCDVTLMHYIKATGFWECIDDRGLPFTVHHTQLHVMDITPHRYRENQFRRYAPAISQVLKSWPTQVSFSPKPLSPETFAARFRDAIKAKRQYGYKDPSIDEKLFAEYSVDIAASMQGDMVIVGPRDSFKRGRPPVSLSEGSVHSVFPPNKAEVLTLDGDDALEQYCRLASTSKILITNITIKAVHITPSMAASAQERYGITIIASADEPSTYILL
jgi:hypothetical protein